MLKILAKLVREMNGLEASKIFINNLTNFNNAGFAVLQK